MSRNKPKVARELYEAVHAAEAAAQRSVCDIPDGKLPSALERARQLRTEANLATTGGVPLQACGGADPEVVRLEAPYRRRRATTEGPDNEQLPTGSLDTPDTTEKE